MGGLELGAMLEASQMKAKDQSTNLKVYLNDLLSKVRLFGRGRVGLGGGGGLERLRYF